MLLSSFRRRTAECLRLACAVAGVTLARLPLLAPKCLTPNRHNCGPVSWVSRAGLHASWRVTVIITFADDGLEIPLDVDVGIGMKIDEPTPTDHGGT